MVNPRKRKNETCDEFAVRASKAYYNDGSTIEEVAKKLGISDIEVYNAVSADGRKITTEKERRKMIKLRKKGYSYAKIAKEMGCGISCVRSRIASPAKITAGGANNALSEKDVQEMKVLYANGATIGELAKKFNVSKHSIISRFQRCGIYAPQSTPNTVTKKEISAFKRYRAKGLSYKEIGKKTHRSATTVRKYCS